jgi:hypothetical protein
MTSASLRFDKVERNKLLFLATVSSREGVPELEVERKVSLGKPVELRIEELNSGGSLSPLGSEVLRFQLTGKPSDVPTLPTWLVTITTTPGGGESALVLRARTGPNADFEELARLDVSVPVSKHNQAKAPIVKKLPLFPRLVVGLNDALPDVLPGDEEGDSIATDPAGLGPYLLRLLRVLSERGTLDKAWIAQNETPVEFDAENATLQQAEQGWARQVAEMASLCAYGGAGGTYGVADEANVTVGHIQKGDAASDNPYYPITFACQQLGSFIIGSRGLRPFPKGFFGPRVLNAGADTAPLFPEMGGRWIILPDGSRPPQELVNGGGGNPNNMDNSTLLKKAEKLFEIDEVFPDTPFAPGATFLYSNRLAKRSIGFTVGSRGCEVMTQLSGREEVCIVPQSLPDGGTGPGSRVESVWPVLPPVDKKPDILKNNTAGAHVGTTLRVMRVPPGANPLRSRQLSRFQVLDTGGLRVKSWSDGVQALDARGANMHAGIFEGPATDEVGDGDPLRGVGVLAKVQPSDAPIMAKHTRDVLQKARPLGFARLLLRKRSSPLTFNNAAKSLTDGTIVFLSALVPMYASEQALKEAGLDKATELAPFANFHLTRLLWSLRNAPDLANVEPTWLIYLPRGPLLTEMRFDPGRSKTAAEMAQSVVDDFLKKSNGLALLRANGMVVNNRPDLNRVLALRTTPIMSITARADGVVQRKSANHPITVQEGHDGRSKIVAPMSQFFPSTATSFPGFFKGVF